MVVDDVSAIAAVWAVASLIVSVIVWRNDTLTRDKISSLAKEVERLRDCLEKLRDSKS